MKSKIVNLLIVAALSVSGTVPAFANTSATVQNTITESEIQSESNIDNNEVTIETYHIDMNDMFNISNPNIRASYSLGVFKDSYSKYKNLLNNTQLEIYNFLIRDRKSVV